jgi:dihydroorotase
MKLSLRRPDDWHLHVRDGRVLQSVVGHTARCFGRAIIMPNLKPPVTTVAAATAYRQRIVDALPADSAFQPLMTLYLTDCTRPAEIDKARECGFVHGVKLYPAGATTNADSGVTDIEQTYAVLERMQDIGMPLLVHAELTDADIDVFDREALYIERVLEPLVQRYPALRLVLEHVSTEQGVAFVRDGGANIAGTLTAHHLLLNRNAMFAGGIRPHSYCLPVLKRERHRRALMDAAASGSAKFFLGTDSAPHPRSAKESACGCAGLYTAHAAIELYAEAFDRIGALDRLEDFASGFGADFYRLPRNSDSITLVKEGWTVPDSYPLGDDTLIPMRAGERIQWTLQ